MNEKARNRSLNAFLAALQTTEVVECELDSLIAENYDTAGWSPDIRRALIAARHRVYHVRVLLDAIADEARAKPNVLRDPSWLHGARERVGKVREHCNAMLDAMAHAEQSFGEKQPRDWPLLFDMAGDIPGLLDRADNAFCSATRQ